MGLTVAFQHEVVCSSRYVSNVLVGMHDYPDAL